MKHKNQHGFTVIETTLFLALSSALVLVAILGTGSVMNSTRFTDSLRSSEAFVQAQYTEVLNGVNPRAANSACNGAVSSRGASNCLLLGKLVYFEEDSNKVTSYYVVSEVAELNDPAKSDLTDLEWMLDVKPQIVASTGVSSFDIPWGAKFFGGERRGDDAREANSYLILRSPQSSRLVAYTFNMPRPDPARPATLRLYNRPNDDGASEDDNVNLADEDSIEKLTNFCIRSEEEIGRTAALRVAGGQGASTVDAVFDIAPAECDGDGESV